MNRLICLVTSLLLLVGCTFNVTNISSEGTATDLVDEEQATVVTPTVTVPIAK